jgi:PGF-CTERM protein
MRTRTLTVALLSALLVVSAGTAGALTTNGFQPQESTTNATTSGGDAATQGTPSVTFDDQDSSGESLLVASASLPQQGFVAIYDSSRSGNRTDQVIGASYLLEPGTSDNIRIQLDESLDGSASLTAVVHNDTNGNGEFEYVSSEGQEDAPLTPEGDRRIVDIAQVTVENAGGANETAAGTSNTTAATTDDGATTATTDETTTDETTGGEMTAANETSAEETTANETSAEETATDDAAETTAAADGTAANETNGSGDSGGSGAFGPGFGPVVAVVALLAAALLASRRRE